MNDDRIERMSPDTNLKEYSQEPRVETARGFAGAPDCEPEGCDHSNRSVSVVDSEDISGDDEHQPVDERPANILFKRRHAQYIPICLSIGTGMLFHTGYGLRDAGPAPLFLGYLIVATLLYAVLITSGQMTSLLPIRGALFMLPYRFLNRQAALACGYLVTFGFAFDHPQKAATFVAYLVYWFPNMLICNLGNNSR